MIDITPSVAAGEEVSLGDDIQFVCTIDVNAITDDLTLEIEGASEYVLTGAQLTKTDNGDGTFSYRYKHTIDSLRTIGSWTLSSIGHGKSKGTFILRARH